MTDSILTLLKSLVQQVFDFCQQEIGNKRLSVKRRSVLGEAGLAIYELLEALKVSQADQILLERVLYAIYQIIYDDAALFYFSSFYYSYRNVQSDSDQVQRHFIKVNLDILAMRLKLRLVQAGFARFGSSTDGYFLERLERLTWGIKYIFKKKRSDFYVPALYTLLNLHQTLIELLGSGIDNNEKVDVNLQLVHVLLDEVISDEGMQQKLQSLPQLRFFLVDQQRRYQRLLGQKTSFKFDLVDFEALDWTPQLRCLVSLSYHDSNTFIEVCSELLDRWQKYASDIRPIEKILLLRVLVAWLKLEGDKHPLDLDIKYRFENGINLEEFMPKYFSAYLAIPQAPVDSNDLSKLFALDDQELRRRVANIMINVDPVVVRNEATKPHGSVEIADMEIPIELGSDGTYYLCMPFKSAREIRHSTVPVNYFYQIARPFAFFDKCIVVFITAKKCSQQLWNLIKQMREKYNWPIGVIEHKQLAALLKLNGQL